MLTVFAVAAGTVFLLGLGAYCGFWAGTRVLPPGIMQFDGEEKLDRAVVNQVARCLELSESNETQSEQILKLAYAVAPAASELHGAVSQLHLSMRELNEGLHSLRSLVPPIEEDAPERNAGESEVNASQPPRKPGRLTVSEISEVIGGRQHIGESTFGIESHRFPYDCEQLFAACEAGERPTLSDFATVRCHRISVTGLSFFLPDRPKFETLAISVGEGERRIFIAAEVRDQKAVFMRGEVSYLVSCRFTKRLDDLTAEWQQSLSEPTAVA